jgi:hypothetical protein
MVCSSPFSGDYQPLPQTSTQPLPQCLTCGDFVASKIIQGARTPTYLQTDLVVTHTFNLSKSHENYKLELSGNVYNLLNQRSALGVSENVNGSINGQLISPVRGGADRFSGDPHVDWNIVMRPYSYVDALNGEGAFGATVQVPCASGSTGCGSNGFKPTVVESPMTLASRYGMGNVFQTARQLRLVVRFIF